ncbi:MAG: helix-turn-helix transcriptional regulator, partial [Bacillota bacterium]
MTLGARIRQLRKSKGMTARALAERVGLHPQHVFSI